MPMRKVMTGCISRERDRMTAKKKPYSFTIGFNEKKPDHVRAAQILNELRKGEKSDYIARCILAYEGEKAESGEVSFAAIREIVRQILQEDYPKIQQKPEQADSAEQVIDLSEHTTQESELTQSVIRSMAAFRKSNT